MSGTHGHHGHIAELPHGEDYISLERDSKDGSSKIKPARAFENLIRAVNALTKRTGGTEARALPLRKYATADLPDAAAWAECILYDTDVDAPKVSDGASWLTLSLGAAGTWQPYDADLDTWATITPAAGVATFLATPTSANLRAAVTNETGSGSLVFATSPSLVTPDIGAATGTSLALTDSLAVTKSAASLVSATITNLNAGAGAAAGVQFITDAGTAKLQLANAAGLSLTALSVPSGFGLICNSVSAMTATSTTLSLLLPTTLADASALGTPTSGNLANCTAYPIASLAGISANATTLLGHTFAQMRADLDLEAGTDFYSISAADAAFQPKDSDLTSWASVTRASGFDTFAATPSSANLRGLLTDETGSGGAAVFATGPTVTTLTVSSGGVDSTGNNVFNRASNVPLVANRTTNDGSVIDIRQDGTTEGSISVSGTTVSYGAFMGSHWAQFAEFATPDLLDGTIIESIDEMCAWAWDEWFAPVVNDDGLWRYERRRTFYVGEMKDGASYEDELGFTHTVRHEKNDRLARVKVSDEAGSCAVYGVYFARDASEEAPDYSIASLGAGRIRIAKGQSPKRGDLIESNGDGCGRVQADNILRASTVAKITAAIPVAAYPDGSFVLPCTLHCG